jgi:hypothetical protein
VNLSRGLPLGNYNALLQVVALVSALGAYFDRRWAVVPFFLVTVLSALGLFAYLLVLPATFHGSTHPIAAVAGELLALAILSIQVVAWFLYQAYWSSLRPERSARR